MDLIERTLKAWASRISAVVVERAGWVVMDEDLDRRYDTYLIRVWRERSSDRWLRAEVRHVQSAWSVDRRWSDEESADALGWICDQLQDETDVAREPVIDDDGP